MLKINDRKWKEYKIEDIFDVGGTVTTKPQDLLLNGKTPRVTCAAVDNGFDGLYNNESTEERNVITIDSATIGAVFFQPYDFIATDHVEKLKLKYHTMNKYIGLFLKNAIDKAKCTKYDYGYKFSQTRIKRQTFKLPIDKKGNPDYDFMEQFIKEREELKKKEYIEYAKKKISKLKQVDRKMGGGYKRKVIFKSFYISEVFDEIERGKRLTKEKQVDGNKPYVSSTAMNNGVDAFIGNKNDVREFNNCLSLANSGSVGACFYEPFRFIASDHITHLKKENYNEHQYIFLATMLSRLSSKYNFNREINDERIKREKIVLPTKNNKIDFDYMDNFIREKELEKYQEYINFNNV